MCSTPACTARHGRAVGKISEAQRRFPSPSRRKGKEKITFDHVSIADATRYSAEDADVTLRCGCCSSRF